MFGLSLEHLVILLVAGLFIVGPERLPESARWLAQTLRKARTFAAGAQERLQNELGPEFTQLRKPLEDLRSLRSFAPKAALGRYLLDDSPPAAAGEKIAAGSPAATPPRPGERAPVDPDAT
ncbi:sec-independent protein translocase protein TatB [Amycolatopsis sp. NBRC 101858]|uniref:twin-arginine translocase TatA/TatE family subunit n=1 Tax=Amycolatopsis sp. NBRC 101858 TaxID=3032200 RepID=UPI0024A19C1C|nr:twin-arginine translocase TatA/TatE family subunit [Amycolatopsis sp. NBRC 101858]GLY38099.1 sec-independent protein translocase protein TatB [Amycolatopsis sp. NBRC 101858]